MFSKLLGLMFILVFSLPFSSAAQTRSVYHFEDNAQYPSYLALKQQMKDISSDTVDEYKIVLIQQGEERADQLIMPRIREALEPIYNMAYCHDCALQSGWTQKQIDQQLPELVKKADAIRRRLKKIQDAAKRTAPTVLFY